MKSLYFLTPFLFIFTGFVPKGSEPPAAKVAWIEFSDVDSLAQTSWAVSKKPVFIDVYTTWCGPCKRFSQYTLTDPEVIAYLNEHYYAIKFDAESKDSITLGQQTYHYIPPQNGARRGVHHLAYLLLQGSLQYPSLVFLNPDNLDIMAVERGARDPKGFLLLLKYHAEGRKTGLTFEEFQAKENAQ